MSSISNLWTQTFPPAPRFTDLECQDLTGKVFIITGGTGGIGLELAQILYRKNGKVCITGRSSSVDKAAKIISEVKAKYTASTGELWFLSLDLNDLTTIKTSAEQFLVRASRLDVLWNNAGVMIPPSGSKTAQGHELQLGVHCLGHFLFTQLLSPILIKTAQISQPCTVRIIWLSSLAIERYAPTGGLVLDTLGHEEGLSQWVNYAQSKVGCYFLSVEMASRMRDRGVINLCANPGNVQTSIQRYVPKLQMMLLWKAVYGSYTELYAGLSPDITLQHSGRYIVPFGRLGVVRDDIQAQTQISGHGNATLSNKFLVWCEQQTEQFMS
ncbi:hypothetical protein OIDMADRAFT_136491 [Oidiodendron maius Zn]|uniref:Ketoreductase (KR) domain-containing protein n=1 Tax=Oidiodendron maius (strain Zn) TaxID=913774 RepID=A0A0C3GD73_OIDMZ|nr:hypothetical protein OIDMADRAFT_136491 [Oidiodendron maius Zn]